MTAPLQKLPIRRDGERGFALLLVFLLAAAVALMLYQQMPRVAFESEREKEQMLQDRGHEYVRGVQLYYVAFKKYPSKLEDLENTNNKRFLRRRYIDPMTGKDEWRLIHVNGAGQLTDSVVQKPPTPQNANSHDPNNPLAAFGTGAGSGIATGTGTGTGTGTDGQPDVNAAVLRRPSDRNLLPQGGNLPANIDPNDPRYWPPTTTVPVIGNNGVNGVVNGINGGINGGVNGQFGTQFPGGQQQFPGQQQYPGQQQGTLPGGFQPGLPGQNFPPGVNQTVNGGLGIGVQNGLPVQGGIVPGGVYGQFPQGNSPTGGAMGPPMTGSPTEALGAINNALRTPQQAQTGNMNAIGVGGLAGVASTYVSPSIKIYKDRQKYNEWEFIFDLKQAMPGQGQNGQPGLGQGGPGQRQGQGPGQQGTGTGQGTGNQGGSSIFPNGNSIFPGTGTSSTTIKQN